MLVMKYKLMKKKIKIFINNFPTATPVASRDGGRVSLANLLDFLHDTIMTLLGNFLVNVFFAFAFPLVSLDWLVAINI